MKQDIRIETSKRIIKEGFKNLLQTNDVHSITVKQICEETGISRTTLYRHYESIDDIILDIEYDCVQKLDKLIRSVKNADAALILSAVLRETQAEPDYLKIALRDSDRFNNILAEKTFPFVQKIMAYRWNKKTEEQQRMLFRFIVFGVNGLIKDWIDSGFTMDSQMIADIVKGIEF